MDLPVGDKWQLVDRALYAECSHRVMLGKLAENYRQVAVRQRNGVTVCRRQCRTCGFVAPGADAGSPDSLTLVVDATLNTPACERCGSRVGTERHHWAPWGVFHAEADDWPSSYLCKECHAEWHRAMRNAGLREQPWEDG